MDTTNVNCNAGTEGFASIVIHNHYGGFHLSDDCVEYLESKGVNMDEECLMGDHSFMSRDNPHLLDYLRTEKGKKNNPKLKIVDIPARYRDGNFYRINEYDGKEHVELDKFAYDIHVEKMALQNVIDGVNCILNANFDNDMKISLLKEYMVENLK